MNEDEAFEHVKGTLKEEGITPYRIDELEVVRSVGSCINCGLCIQHCPVVAVVGVDRFSGPRSIAVELSRSPPEFWTTADTVYLCTGCGTCREVCPKNVNIPEVVNMIRARIFDHRPDLVPKGLHVVREVITQHSLAFEPWEDKEEKVQSRDMRLERLGLPFIENPKLDQAEILFYPGCQAEERAQEVREAAKVILDFFDVNFTVLDEMSCCGLPSVLMGDDATARSLAKNLKQKVKKLDAKMVVTTCAGCTSNLSEISERDGWEIPAIHILEFLAEEIGLEKLGAAVKKSTEFSDVHVSVHDPCHLIKHTSRQVMEYALDILGQFPGVKVTESEANDSCCGGGGLVAYHSNDVADAVVKENLEAIQKTGADKLVTPCPLCTAQIESNLFKSGSSVEVDDLTVFIAQRLPKKR
ncbi:MAG: (Fe-S)-binding protein [Candidatus Thorarchaeota archaeon]|jgi:fumarate reductase (CoM/CoB) subunit B